MRPIESPRSKKDLVYEALRDAILEGDLEPGERIVIDELAESLHVSPIPVREALQRLQAEGFVTIEPYVGVSVTELHEGLISEIFDLLEALEVLSTRSACRRMGEKDLDEMEAILRRMDGLVDQPNRFSQENVRLHQFICERANTPLVQSLMSKTLAHWDRLRRHYLKDVFADRISEAQREHWKMLNALRAHDAQRVERIVRTHNRTAHAAYARHLQRLGILSTTMIQGERQC